jgi:penicillin-insensitive murein DD-endopeptidase
MWKACLAFSAVLLSSALVYGAPSLNPWPSISEPAPGPARSIGEYSAGCLQGGVALPLDGVGYQVMRPGRHRNYGHPALVDYVRELGRDVKRKRLGVLLVGDLSQPRGGRSSNGHASHQTGLDVDIWYTHPPRALRGPLPLLVREELEADSVVDDKRQVLVPRWRSHVSKLLRLAADGPHVDRIFVNPAIKQALCEQRQEPRGWLRKIRPWYGHADHFHVRLGCMAGDVDCQGQATLPPGDGCDKLSMWIKPRTRVVKRKPAPVAGARKNNSYQKTLQQYRKAIHEGRGWPERCDALLDSVPVSGRVAMPSST